MTAVSQLRGERAAAEARAVALEVQLGSARTAAEGVGAAVAQLEEKASPHHSHSLKRSQMVVCKAWVMTHCEYKACELCTACSTRFWEPLAI